MPLVFLVLFVGAGAWFWLSYIPRERAAAIDAWGRDLGLRADIRKEALQRYFTDSFADAVTLASYPTVLRALTSESGDVASSAVTEKAQRGHLEELFNDFARIHAVLGVVLWDAAARPVAKSRDLAVESGCAGPAREVLSSGRPAAGFHEHPGIGPVLTFGAPVRSADGRTHGAIVVAVDPREWLYPLLARPLVGTSSGEAILIARDGAEAVYLSPVRHRPDAPLHYRRPLDTPGFAARAALEGVETVGPYVDYRGVRVLSAGARLPPSPWALVVKVDEDEALADFRRRMWRMAVGGAVGFLGILGVAWGVWQRRERLQVAALAKSAERIRQLNRLLKTISEVNQIMVRVDDKKTLLAEACRVLVEHGGFRMVWIGFADAASGRVVPEARAGEGLDYLDGVADRFDDAPDGHGPAGAAIRTGHRVLVADVATDPAAIAWREQHLAYGLRSAGSFPFSVRGEVTGALTVYQGDVFVFDDEETALLEELAADLGHAIEALEIRDEHRRAENALRASEEKLRALAADLENRVETRTADLEAANKELEAFSYSVSHDLRSPLRAMDGFSRILLEDHAGQLDAEGKRLLGVVRSGARKMGELIDALLAFSRIGRVEIAKADVDMARLARSVFEELAGPGPGRPTFVVGPLPDAFVDASLMRQVWMNLISNALKFTGAKVDRLIEVGARTELDRIVYWVKDNGVGFDMAYVDKLFGVFQRLHSASEFEGTGVGLALVQRIVHRHGGEARAEGKVGEGATFSFNLPRKGGPP